MGSVALETPLEKGNGTAAPCPGPEVLTRIKAAWQAQKAKADAQLAALDAAEKRDQAKRAAPVKAHQHSLIRAMISSELSGTVATSLAEAAAALEQFQLIFESDARLAVADPHVSNATYDVVLRREGLADLIVTFARRDDGSFYVMECRAGHHEVTGRWIVQSYEVGEDGKVTPEDLGDGIKPAYLCKSFGEALAKAEQEWTRVRGASAELVAAAEEKGMTQPGLSEQLAAVTAERDKLAKFKQYVHGRLDAVGVPADPESPHKAEGCRIGGRLDCVLAAWGRVSATDPGRLMNTRGNNQVTIDYTSWKGLRSVRTIRPIRLWYGTNEWHTEGGWLLDAWDVEKAAVRTFALSGMHKWNGADVGAWREAAIKIITEAAEQAAEVRWQGCVAGLLDTLRTVKERIIAPMWGHWPGTMSITAADVEGAINAAVGAAGKAAPDTAGIVDGVRAAEEREWKCIGCGATFGGSGELAAHVQKCRKAPRPCDENEGTVNGDHKSERSEEDDGILCC